MCYCSTKLVLFWSGPLDTNPSVMWPSKNGIRVHWQKKDLYYKTCWPITLALAIFIFSFSCTKPKSLFTIFRIKKKVKHAFTDGVLGNGINCRCRPMDSSRSHLATVQQFQGNIGWMWYIAGHGGLSSKQLYPEQAFTNFTISSSVHCERQTGGRILSISSL